MTSCTLPERASTVRIVDEGGTLDELIVSVWRACGHVTVECPVCREEMAPEYGVHARAIGGRCSTCGSSGVADARDSATAQRARTRCSRDGRCAGPRGGGGRTPAGCGAGRRGSLTAPVVTVVSTLRHAPALCLIAAG